MNDEICECGHSINKHYLDNPSSGDASGYCTHYYEDKHIFCNCSKSPSDIAAALRAELTQAREERDAMKAKLVMVSKWFERQADLFKKQSTDTRFETISSAAKADAKNYQAMADDILAAALERGQA